MNIVLSKDFLESQKARLVRLRNQRKGLEKKGVELIDLPEFWQIDRAVGHINKGRYGQCENCPGKIELSRLRKTPEASVCSECRDLLAEDEQIIESMSRAMVG